MSNKPPASVSFFATFVTVLSFFKRGDSFCYMLVILFWRMIIKLNVLNQCIDLLLHLPLHWVKEHCFRDNFMGSKAYDCCIYEWSKIKAENFF